MTERDKIMAEEYLIDFNASAAAIRAGYSPATARNAAAWIKEDNPAKPQLRALIDRKIAERSRRTGISADRVLGELAKIAFANASDFLDTETGKIKPDAGKDDQAAIAGVKVKKGDDFTEREIKLHDKNRALELLGKHLGLFAENLRVEGAVPVIVDDSE